MAAGSLQCFGPQLYYVTFTTSHYFSYRYICVSGFSPDRPLPVFSLLCNFLYFQTSHRSCCLICLLSRGAWLLLTGTPPNGAQRLACTTLALFCLHHLLPFPRISLPTLLAFIEFLTFNSLSVPTIENYISSIKSHFNLAALSVSVFTSPQLALVLSSLEKNAVPLAPHKPIFSPSQLLLLFRAISLLPLATLYSMAFSLAFLAMLRISNLALLNSSSFDPHRHPCRGIFLSLLVNWSSSCIGPRPFSAIIKPLTFSSFLFRALLCALFKLCLFFSAPFRSVLRILYSLIILLAALCSLLKVTFAGSSGLLSSLWVLTLL
jgi:hypothetical protein